MGTNNIKKSSNERSEALKKGLEEMHDPNTSRFFDMLENLTSAQIKNMQQIMNAIDIKASSEGINNSSDLLMKCVSIHSNEIVIPYKHFPNSIEQHEINTIIRKLTDDFSVFIMCRFVDDNVHVRFPYYNNLAFMKLKKLIDIKNKKISTSGKNKLTETALEIICINNQTLSVNKNTGEIKLNNIASIINPSSSEFNILLKILSSKDFKATYEDLLGENYSKIKTRNLGFKIRNLKKYLGILPRSKTSNTDIIKNIKGHGYMFVK